MGKRELKYGGIQGLLLEWENKNLKVIKQRKKTEFNQGNGISYISFQVRY